MYILEGLTFANKMHIRTAEPLERVLCGSCNEGDRYVSAVVKTQFAFILKESFKDNPQSC